MFLVLSANLVADDGHINTGGKSCPANQTCLASQEQPEPGKADSEFIDIFKRIVDFIYNVV